MNKDHPMAEEASSDTAMIRRHIVLDYGLHMLMNPLKSLGFHVILAPLSVYRSEESQLFIGDRLIVTARPMLFQENAAIYGFGIINIGPLFDQGLGLDGFEGVMATAIGKCLTNFDAFNRREAFVISVGAAGEDSTLVKIS